MTEEAIAQCVRCAHMHKTKPAKSGGLKLPLGWKRVDEGSVCADCWKKSYVLRALTFAIVKPLSGSWRELEADLKQMWVQTTAASNWMMTECYASDIRRADEKKMPPMPRLYLYPQARIKFPDLPAQTIAALEQSVQRKYRAKRFDIVWTSAASLLTFRYPQPFPQHNQMWSFTFIAEGKTPVVSARIGDKRWELQLKGGARYARQIAGLKKMEHRGEMALYKAHNGTILCKLVGWLPRLQGRARMSGTLFVRTTSEQLLIAVDAKDERIWTENCDHLKRWIAEHNANMQRLSEDQKAEQRPHPSFEKRRTEAVQKQKNRVNSSIQEIAAHVANFATRRKFAQVIYDDTERGFMGAGFPYFRLAERLATNLDERGIEFEHRGPKEPGIQEMDASGDPATKSP